MFIAALKFSKITLVRLRHQRTVVSVEDFTIRHPDESIVDWRARVSRDGDEEWVQKNFPGVPYDIVGDGS